MNEIDAFIKSKSKLRFAMRRQGEHVYFYDGIKYTSLFRGLEREAYPHEVLGFLDWKPGVDIVNKELR